MAQRLTSPRMTQTSPTTCWRPATSFRKIEVLYGILCEGDFQRVVHFERKDASSAARLGEIVEGCLEIAWGRRL